MAKSVEINKEIEFRKLSSNKNGLSEKEAEERLKTYGYNEITSKKVNPIKKLLLKFWGPIPLMLFIVIIMSAFLGRYTDAYIVIGLLLFNGAASFFEEFKADNTLELLKNKLSVNVNVQRDNEWKKLPSKFLVPGDIIRVRMGDIIPADCLIIEGD